MTASVPQAALPLASKPESTLRRSLRLILIAWFFGAFWQWIISGAAMTRFARGLDMPDWAFGLLAMIPPIAGIAQLPASVILQRFGRRKAVFIVTQSIARVTWVLIAAIPWLLPQHRYLWWPVMLVVVFISWSGANLAAPAWMNWMADIIPVKLRGRYFGLRNRLGQIIGVVVTLAVGFMLDAADHLAAVTALDSEKLMLATTSALIALAGLVGVLDIQCFARVPDATPPASEQKINWHVFLTQPLKDRSFCYLLAYNFLLWLGIGSLGQYLWLYLFDVVMVSNRDANLMLAALPLVGFALTFPLWGRLIDRVGCKPVLIICSVLSALGPLFWVLVQPGMVWQGYALVFTGILVWPGVEIALFNLLLGIAASGKGGGAYVAYNALAVGVGGVVSGIVAAILAKLFVDSVWKIESLNLILTYHTLIMLFSFAVRMAAVPLALGIEEPRAHKTQQVIKYMSTTLHSNFRSFVLMPNRLVAQSVRRLSRQAKKPLPQQEEAGKSNT